MENKQYVWVLNVQRAIRTDEWSDAQEISGTWAYSDFETARAEMRMLAKQYAFSESELFDGNGHIKGLQEYLQQSLGNKKEMDDEFGDPLEGYGMDELASLSESLRSFFLGEPVQIGEIDWTDWLVCVSFQPKTPYGPMLDIHGVDDGPSNGIDPYILINAFEMDDPDIPYSIRVRNQFDYPGSSSYMELDLVKVEVDEKIGDDI